MKRQKIDLVENETGATIRQRLSILRKIAPKKSGLQLYRIQAQRVQTARTATLYIYIRSNENTYALHETFFKRKRPMTPIEWEHYFRSVVLAGSGDNEDEPIIRLGVLQGAIIPGINLRTNKQWSVRAIIGYIAHAVHKPVSAKVSKKRHQTKSQGKQIGQTHLRRGHRNCARKAK